MNAYVTILGRRIGFEYSRVWFQARPYLDRYICYLGGPTLRFHKFWRGDDDRAPHDHPWWFITFPFKSYVEKYWEPKPISTLDGRIVELWTEKVRIVKSWRFHYRPALFRHIVLGRAAKMTKELRERWPGGTAFGSTPFWTFVISGPRKRSWGFWPRPNKFVNWKEWT
jgi:hypothetical protein